MNLAYSYCSKSSRGALLLCKVLVGKSHDMKGVGDHGCQRRPNFDSHVSNANGTGPEAQQIVVFEKEQVLPVYRIVFNP